MYGGRKVRPTECGIKYEICEVFRLFGSPPLGLIESVVKLGGSLLEAPDLVERVSDLAKLAPGALWVVGGGAVADVVRDWDARYALGDERAHRLALAAMNFNARLLEELCPGFQRVCDAAEASGVLGAGNMPVVNALEWTRRREADGAAPLPRTWELTSDSVAGWIARDVGAIRLWMVKSTDPPGPADDPSRPKIDVRFSQYAGDTPELLWVNARRTPLRAETFRVS